MKMSYIHILNLRWMFLVLLCDLGSLANRMEPLLLQKISKGSWMEGMTSRSSVNFFIQAASCAASEAIMYYDYVVDCTTMFCLELIQ